MKNVKKYLNRIRYLDMSIQALQEEIDSTRASFLGAAQMKEDKVQESKKGTYDDQYVRYIELNKSVNDEIDKLINLKKTVGQQINQIENVKEQVVLRYRYLLNNQWKEIAYKLECTERHVHKIHGKALLSFKERFDDFE